MITASPQLSMLAKKQVNVQVRIFNVNAINVQPEENMQNKEKLTDNHRKARKSIHEIIDTLLEDDVHPAPIAFNLVGHAISLSFATCDDPKLILRNLLMAVLVAMPNQDDQELGTQSDEMDILASHLGNSLLN